MAEVTFAPLMMSVEEFARAHGISKTTARECIAGTSKNYPPLMAKRLKNGRIYITAEQAKDWRDRLEDA